MCSWSDNTTAVSAEYAAHAAAPATTLDFKATSRLHRGQQYVTNPDHVRLDRQRIAIVRARKVGALLFRGRDPHPHVDVEPPPVRPLRARLFRREHRARLGQSRLRFVQPPAEGR